MSCATTHKPLNEQLISKLTNFLKLPKAIRWICCEWFYSDIDRVIFESENDFSLCIQQSFPKLKTRKLTRKQWCILRSLIGKPRRCSQAFFQEERQMLDEKRQKIRLIQQRKVSEQEASELNDLPQDIPLPLSIGHRVYAHICTPEEGVFLGTIAAIDLVEHTYRVVFDRMNIGSQTVADYEIKSVAPIQTVPIKAYIQTFRPKTTHTTPLKYSNPYLLLDESNVHSLMQSDSINSPLKLSDLNDLSQKSIDSEYGGYLGGFPVRLLVLITRLNKILLVKKDFIKKLNELNVQAEKYKAKNETCPREFQFKYASLVLELEKLNKDLNDYQIGVQTYCEEFSPELTPFSNPVCNSNELRNRTYKEAKEIFDKINKFSNNTTIIKSTHTSEFITKLTSLMLQIRDYSNANVNNNTLDDDSPSNNYNSLSNTIYFDTKAINITIDEIKKSINPKNIKLFEDKIQVHLNHINSGLSQFNTLHAFKESDDSVTHILNQTNE
jgi:protein lin-9